MPRGVFHWNTPPVRAQESTSRARNRDGKLSGYGGDVLTALLIELVVQVAHGVFAFRSVFLTTQGPQPSEPACAERSWDTTPIRPGVA